MATENITIARPYAKAAFNAALESQEAKAWNTFLQAGALVTLEPKVLALLQDPAVTDEKCFEFYHSVLSQYLNENRANFLKLLISNGRLQTLPQISVLFTELLANQEKTVEVQVRSFSPMSDDQQNQLAKKLEIQLKRKVSLLCEVDASLLGGAIIKAGDLVIDGSIRSKLKKLARDLAA